MSFMKLSIFAASYSLLCLSLSQQEIQKVILKSVQCNASEKFAYQNYSCYVKSFRSSTAINVIAQFKAPVSDIQVLTTLNYKFGSTYRQITHIPIFEVEAEKSNEALAALMQVMRDTVPSAIHECPYTEIVVKNCSARISKIIPIFPSGDYHMLLFFMTQKGENIGAINIFGTVISPNKKRIG